MVMVEEKLLYDSPLSLLIRDLNLLSLVVVFFAPFLFLEKKVFCGEL